MLTDFQEQNFTLVCSPVKALASYILAQAKKNLAASPDTQAFSAQLSCL